jgi:hypothetical protein
MSECVCESVVKEAVSLQRVLLANDLVEEEDAKNVRELVFAPSRGISHAVSE